MEQSERNTAYVRNSERAQARKQRLTRVLSDRGKLGVDQVFVVWTSKSGLNQMGLGFLGF